MQGRAVPEKHFENDTLSGIWNCVKCRLMTSQMGELLNIIKALQSGLQGMTTTQIQMQTNLTQVSSDCKALRDENTQLRNQIQSLKEEINPVQKETLVIGDSLI